jgi:putative phosphoesterase
MTTKIGLISDVHASPGALAEALSLFQQQQVSEIICAGDIAGYFDTLTPCIELLKQHDCKTIIGNHDQTYLKENSGNNRSEDFLYLEALPETLQFNIQGKSMYVVHAEPPNLQHGGIKLLDQQGEIIHSRIQLWTNELANLEHDILIVGHTHQVFAEQLGHVFVVNPGSSAFNHSCMILTLPDMTIQTYALENRDIIKCWNFSMLYGSGSPYPNSSD